MGRRAVRLVAAVFAAASLGVVVTPGCVIKLGKGTGPDETEGAGGSGATGSEGGTAGEAGAGGSYLDDEIQMGEEAYAQLDQQELAFASARAGHMTCALSGAVDTGIQVQGLDPESLDLEALLSLVEQYAPEATAEVDALLAGVDPSTLAYTVKPKPECMDQGCKYAEKCQKPGYIPEVSHVCFVDDCGPAKCRTCPDWVNDILQNIAFKTWCSYVCVQSGTSPPKVVAVGAGFISKFLNVFGGPFCIAHP